MRTCLLAALFLSACGPKKPVSYGEADWFPLVEEASWTYRGSFNGRSNEEVRYASTVETSGRPAWIFMEEVDRNDDVAGTFTSMVGLGAYRRTAEGVETADLSWRGDAQGLDEGSFQPMLRLPPVVGDRIVPTTTSVDRSGGWTVAGMESVTVPAGTFQDCARLDLGQGSEAWFCPDVGLVKWVFVTGRVEELVAWNIPGVSAGP